MRKTKIVCTLGPASSSEETLRQMLLNGMNVARINFSHGTHEEHRKKIETIRRVCGALNLSVAIMLDTKGPEYRIKTFANGPVTLKEGGSFSLYVDDRPGDERGVSVNYASLADDLEPGDRVTHATFGEGEILSIKPMGADKLIEVMFDTVGTKKLMLKSAGAHMKKL